jgi:quinol monooxygenase YgiN
MIAVTLRLVARAETREELARRVREDLLGPTRQEPGCISYRFYQDIEDPNAFSFVELWQDYDALDGHFRSAHVGAFLGRLPDLVAEPPVARFDRIAETRGLEAVEAARKSVDVPM